MHSTKLQNERGDWSSRAMILRCSDQSWYQLLDFVRSSPDCFLVFSKSSKLKLVIQEEGW